MNVFTLSEYLGRRYDDRSRVSFAVIMVVIMVVVQMVPGFYFGSRSVNRLLQGDTGSKAMVEAVVDAEGSLSEISIKNEGRKYAKAPEVMIQGGGGGEARAEIDDQGRLSSITLIEKGSGYDAKKAPLIILKGGNERNEMISPGDVDPTHYQIGILVMALVTGAYVILGGLRAVIITDVIQSVLMLIGGLIVAFIVFNLPEVGGWSGMRAMDAAAAPGSQKMHLYESSDHPTLPWTGMLSGLMVLHFFYWGTNQFIVQRALSARSDKEARIGIITAVFFNLLIPFFSIGTGIAAFYLFKKNNMIVASDDVFITLLTQYVKPIGFGVLGLVAAGLIGAILSTVDSMLNSAATLITFDVYKRFINPEATDKQLIRVGRQCILLFVIGSAFLTIFIFDPNSEKPFFTYVASHQSRLIAGLVVAFGVGMLWKGATATGGFAAIITGLVVSYGLPPLYAMTLGQKKTIASLFGQNLNFFHAVFVAAIVSTLAHVIVSKITMTDERKSQLTWHGLGLISKEQLASYGKRLLLSALVFAGLGSCMVNNFISPAVAATFGSCWTLCIIVFSVKQSQRKDNEKGIDDRYLAGILASCAVFILFYFY